MKYTTIKVTFTLTVHYDFELEQIVVKTAFSHGDLDNKQIKHVCMLKKSLYGLKQSPRQWYNMFDNFVTSVGFVRSEFDHCLYFNNHDLSGYFLFYVDDMLLSGVNMNKIKRYLSKELKMKYLGHTKRILGMNIIRNRPKQILVLKQTSYAEKCYQNLLSII